jgi:hypothetical protein
MFENIAENITMIGGLVAAIVGFFVAFIEHKKLNPNKKNFGWILLISGACTALGTYFSSLDNNKKTEELGKKAEQLINANRTIDSLLKINTAISNSNSNKLDSSFIRLNHIVDESNSVLKKLKNQSRKLVEVQKLNENIHNNVTGGESYCEVEVLSLQDNGKTIYFLGVMNKGDFPLEEVSIELINTTKFKQRKRTDRQATLQDLSEKEYIKIGNILPHGTAMLNREIILAEGEIVEFGIPIQTKNKFMGQSLRITKIGDKIFTASKIGINGSIGQKGRILSDKADKGFPNEHNGKIKWD